MVLTGKRNTNFDDGRKGVTLYFICDDDATQQDSNWIDGKKCDKKTFWSGTDLFTKALAIAPGTEFKFDYGYKGAVRDIIF